MDISYLLARLFKLLPEFFHGLLFYACGLFMMWGAGNGMLDDTMGVIAAMELMIGFILLLFALVIFFKGRDMSRSWHQVLLTILIILPIAAFALGAAPRIIESNKRQKQMEDYRQQQYSEAMLHMDMGRYRQAAEMLGRIPDGKVLYAAEIEECAKLEDYTRVETLFQHGVYDQALEGYIALGDFRDSREKAAQCEDILYEPIYLEAAEKAAQKQYGLAFALYAGIRDYRDVEELLQSPELQQGRKIYYSLGRKITFGSFEQRDIRWLIISRRDNLALVVSEDILEFTSFAPRWDSSGTENMSVWEASYIRYWLNNEFIKEAFDEEQQSCILRAVTSSDTSWPVTQELEAEEELSSSVTDRLFLLSKTEAQMLSKGNRIAYYTGPSNRRTEEDWSLRMPIPEEGYITVVDRNGSMGYTRPISDLHGIRPAMWIELNDEIIWR